MTDADGLKAGIATAIDIEENVASLNTQVIEALGNLQGQVLLLGIEHSNSSEVRDIIRQIQTADQVAHGVGVLLVTIRANLDLWMSTP